MFSGFLSPARNPHCWAVILVVASCITIAEPAIAHEGPPIPLMMDEPAGAFKVSIWADPDIGEGTFYILVETPEGGVPSEEPTVTFWAQPTSGRLEKAVYETKRQALRNRMQFKVYPTFDQHDFWEVGFQITTAAGVTEELLSEVESTPPGGGPWSLLLSSFPFALLGGAWIFGMARHRRRKANSAGPRHTVEGSATAR